MKRRSPMFSITVIGLAMMMVSVPLAMFFSVGQTPPIKPIPNTRQSPDNEKQKATLPVEWHGKSIFAIWQSLCDETKDATLPAELHGISILGTWQSRHGEVLGAIMPPDPHSMYITFTRDKAIWTFFMDGIWKSFDGYCVIDPDGHSGWIDFGQPQSNDPSRIARGLYQITGKSLLISADAVRPTNMEHPSLFKILFNSVLSPPASTLYPTVTNPATTPDAE